MQSTATLPPSRVADLGTGAYRSSFPESAEEINQDAVITVSVYDYLGDAYHAQFVAQKADRLMFLPTETGKVTKKR